MKERVLEMIASGHSYAATAKELGLNVTTVKRIAVPGWADRKRLRDLMTRNERTAAFRKRLEADLRSIQCEDI